MAAMRGANTATIAKYLRDDAAATLTGLLTFDRDPSAPLAVTSGSAVVANLDADKVDGKNAGDISYRKLNVTVGTLGDPTTDHFRITYQVQDEAGNSISEKWSFETWWSDNADTGVPFATLGWTAIDIVTGTRHQAVGGSNETDDVGAFTWLIHTDTNGLAIIDFDANAAETRHVNAYLLGLVKGSQSAAWS